MCSHRGGGCPPPHTMDLKQLPVKPSPVRMPQALPSPLTQVSHTCAVAQPGGFGVHRASINLYKDK